MHLQKSEFLAFIIYLVTLLLFCALFVHINLSPTTRNNTCMPRQTFQVQVLEVMKHGSNSYEITVMCCFCGEKHFHGAGVADGILPIPSDIGDSTSLGCRVPHCAKNKAGMKLHMGHQYELMLDAWYACEKKVKPVLKQ
jgi:hypothetical protein